MNDAWTNAVVVDPQTLRRFESEISALRSVRQRQRRLLHGVVAISLVTLGALGLQSTRLSSAAERLANTSADAKRYMSESRRANAALTALTRSHDQILAATEQAPSVGTKSWGRRFTVTKYLPRSPAYGKTNDGLTATMTKADPDARIIAVDPTLIPYGSWVWIEDLGWYRAEDCGSAIKGFRLDVLTATEDDAMRFGRQDRFVIVVPAETRPSVG